MNVIPNTAQLSADMLAAGAVRGAVAAVGRRRGVGQRGRAARQRAGRGAGRRRAGRAARAAAAPQRRHAGQLRGAARAARPRLRGHHAGPHGVRPPSASVVARHLRQGVLGRLRLVLRPLCRLL